MGKTTENRIRRLERTHRPPPYREVSFGDNFSEEEYVRGPVVDTSSDARCAPTLLLDPPTSTINLPQRIDD